MGIHKALKKKYNNKNIQVVSPSVWGWRQNRIKSIQAFIDLTVCLFNFEDIYYKKVKHNSIHLGHPFSNVKKLEKQEVFNKYNLDHNNKFISIFSFAHRYNAIICIYYIICTNIIIVFKYLNKVFVSIKFH